MLLSFTRSLTEFTKTGCLTPDGKELFPRESVCTIEEWVRFLYNTHDEPLPERDEDENLIGWKRRLADGAKHFCGQKYLPLYDTLFVDEAQDLVIEEIKLLKQWSPVLFFVGDDRQKIHAGSDGLNALAQIVSPLEKHTLPFHYRLVPEICRVADRILLPHGGKKLEETSQYDGPLPGSVESVGPLSRDRQMAQAIIRLKSQIRVYADKIVLGDKLGVIVGKTDSRNEVYEHLENDPDLAGTSKIIRAREGPGDQYDPSIDPEVQICILTEKGCKGLEFRAVHWLYCDELDHHQNQKDYYTAVTRAKTSITFYYEDQLPQVLANTHSAEVDDIWSCS